MPYTIHTAKAKIRDAQDHYRDIDVFSDDLEGALAAIGRNNNQGYRKAAIDAVNAAGDRITRITNNNVATTDETANMVAEEFNETKAYAAGTYVRKVVGTGNTAELKLFRLTADYVANSSWNSASKVEVKLSNDVSDLKSTLSYGLEKIISDNMAFLEKLVFSDGYWKTDGTLSTSTTTFHTEKITVTPGKNYYVEFPSSTTKIIMRNFNNNGSVADSSERTTSGVFTSTTSIVAFNATGNAKTDNIYLLDTESNLVLKNETLISHGATSNGTIILSNCTDPGWYLFTSGVTVTDRPSLFKQGGFILLVLRIGVVGYQIVFPFDWKTFAYRVIGSSWVEPFLPKPYYDKKISIIGDSLSDKSNSTAATRYYDIVDSILGTTSTEYAMSGCGYKRKYNDGDAFYEQAAKIATNTDLVLIFGSFNDHHEYGNRSGEANNLGTVTDTTTDTVLGCVNYTLETIFTRAPKAAVGIILPTPWSQYPPYEVNTPQWSYINGIIEIAKRKCIPVLNLYTESNMRPWDTTFRTNFYNENGVQDSGTHPNSAGHARFAPKVVEFVKSILGQNLDG